MIYRLHAIYMTIYIYRFTNQHEARKEFSKLDNISEITVFLFLEDFWEWDRK